MPPSNPKKKVAREDPGFDPAVSDWRRLPLVRARLARVATSVTGWLYSYSPPDTSGTPNRSFSYYHATTC
ncbi:hypothetical protein SBA3_4610002 [Candidatus Sulfopaludibacter sp. SbA3]|nr:hypothetical protein SBA3_4610002 [Candidatus Sulfopaludibacter sp. SbA3]